jgi:hypothetical protein
MALAAWLLGTATATAGGVCHIHPPADGAEAPPALIGPFADAKRCEHERRGRFGAGGRCHCTADFTPDWLSPRRAPGRDDSGRYEHVQPGLPGTLPLP